MIAFHCCFLQFLFVSELFSLSVCAMLCFNVVFVHGVFVRMNPVLFCNILVIFCLISTFMFLLRSVLLWFVLFSFSCFLSSCSVIAFPVCNVPLCFCVQCCFVLFCFVYTVCFCFNSVSFQYSFVVLCFVSALVLFCIILFRSCFVSVCSVLLC